MPTSYSNGPLLRENSSYDKLSIMSFRTEPPIQKMIGKNKLMSKTQKMAINLKKTMLIKFTENMNLQPDYKRCRCKNQYQVTGCNGFNNFKGDFNTNNFVKKANDRLAVLRKVAIFETPLKDSKLSVYFSSEVCLNILCLNI